jgi:hypothetical protein
MKQMRHNVTRVILRLLRICIFTKIDVSLNVQPATMKPRQQPRKWQHAYLAKRHARLAELQRLSAYPALTNSYYSKMNIHVMLR